MVRLPRLVAWPFTAQRFPATVCRSCRPFPAAAVAVVADVQPGQARRHGVGVGVVELHAVEAGVAGAPGGLGKEAGDRPDVGQVEVAGPLARSPQSSDSSSRGERTASTRPRGASRRAARTLALGAPASGSPRWRRGAGRAERHRPAGRARSSALAPVAVSRRQSRGAGSGAAFGPRSARARRRRGDGARARSDRRRSGAGPARRVADARRLDDQDAGWPLAKRAYRSSPSRVAKPSAVWRQGTMAGTQLRSAGTKPEGNRRGANQRVRCARSRVGQRAGGRAWRTREMEAGSPRSPEGSRPEDTSAWLASRRWESSPASSGARVAEGRGGAPDDRRPGRRSRDRFSGSLDSPGARHGSVE